MADVGVPPWRRRDRRDLAEAATEATAPDRLRRALADAERRLARDLTPGERRIDVVRIGRDLKAGKRRLLEEVRREQRRAARRWASNRSRGIRLERTDRLTGVLVGLYEKGIDHARAEVRDAGLDPDAPARTLAQDPREIRGGQTTRRFQAIVAALDVRLADLSAKLEGETISWDLGSLSAAAITQAVLGLPGARSVATDFVSPPMYAGMGSVWDDLSTAGVVERWTATAILDAATCGPCEANDGATYESWADAQVDFPGGGPYVECDGGPRCRCRLVPEFDV